MRLRVRFDEWALNIVQRYTAVPLTNYLTTRVTRCSEKCVCKSDRGWVCRGGEIKQYRSSQHRKYSPTVQVHFFNHFDLTVHDNRITTGHGSLAYPSSSPGHCLANLLDPSHEGVRYVFYLGFLPCHPLISTRIIPLREHVMETSTRRTQHVIKRTKSARPNVMWPNISTVGT